MDNKQSLEEFKKDEIIRKAYLRNLGDVSLVLKEVNLPETYVMSRLDAIKKVEDDKDRTDVAKRILSLIDQGYQGRKIRILEMLNSLDGVEQAVVSVCHSFPVIRHDDSYEPWHECMFYNCHQRCEVRVDSKMDVYNIKLKMILALQEEDKHLKEFAKDMGFTNLPPTSPTIKQNIIVMGGKDANDKEIIDVVKMPMDFERLSPMDRDRLVDKLTAEITKLEEGNGQPGPDPETK